MFEGTHALAPGGAAAMTTTTTFDRPTAALRSHERRVAERALASCRASRMSRSELARIVANVDATGLFTYGEIAELIGVSWLDVPCLVLEAPVRERTHEPSGRRRRRPVRALSGLPTAR